MRLRKTCAALLCVWWRRCSSRRSRARRQVSPTTAVVTAASQFDLHEGGGFPPPGQVGIHLIGAGLRMNSFSEPCRHGVPSPHAAGARSTGA
jgi:hypothetical protein